MIGGNDSVGGPPREGVDVASTSFPLVKNQGLIEPVGLLNQQRGIQQQSLMLDHHRMRINLHTTKTITLPPTTRRLSIFPVC